MDGGMNWWFYYAEEYGVADKFDGPYSHSVQYNDYNNSMTV